MRRFGIPIRMLATIAAFGALLLLASVVVAVPSIQTVPGPAGGTAPPLPATIDLTKTVGIDSQTCSTHSEIEVPPSTAVYYCYKVKNTSNFTLPRHQLYDDNLPGEILPDNGGEGFLYDFSPGESIDTAQMGFMATTLITQTTTNFAIWESYVDDNLYAQDHAEATVEVLNPAITAQLHIGENDGCAGSSTYLGEEGAAYALCLAIENTGQVTFTEFTLSIPALSVSIDLDASLAPGSQITWSRLQSSRLANHQISANLALPASLTAGTTRKGIPFQATATAQGRIVMQAEGDTFIWLPRVQRGP